MSIVTGFIRDVLSGYIDPEDRRVADRALPRLMVEGLLLGGSGLGVLALIFEIAADAFSVAAYQTLLAIHGAQGYHDIAFVAFAILSVMLFFGIVPAYKAGAYLRPNAGGSGPLVEAIGPARLRGLSWAGTSLFLIDAVLTIIISAISAADVTMLLFPEWAQYRILLAELYAFFIMTVLVAVGPKRAVPLFMLGGGAFTIFTIIALGTVGVTASLNPEWGAMTPMIVSRLEETGVSEHVIRATGDVSALSQAVMFQLLLRSMSSAMLGFSGYEVIPASGKHAAKPRWKVINTALTLAAVFLIGTGLVQLYAANVWQIPSTEGYSTLLIEYEILTANLIGNPAIGDMILAVAGALLATILLLAQGGGYVGGAAVAANASRLGRLPRFFSDDRIGIAVIWGVAAIAIPVIREVVVVEAYYAFGFVSAFVITSTTVFFARDEVLLERGIEPKSGEARSLRFAGLRGIVASYAMAIILVTQKTAALGPIALIATVLTLIQIVVYRGGLRPDPERMAPFDFKACVAVNGTPRYLSGRQRALDEARQRGVAQLVTNLIEAGELAKFNVEPYRIRRLVSHLHMVRPEYWESEDGHGHHEHIPEPSIELEETFQQAYENRAKVLFDIEYYSHYGIFTFVQKYHANWVNEHRNQEKVEKAMLKLLFPMTPFEEVWQQYQQYEWIKIPEEVWQFCRKRYQWAKDQWPNLSDPITTIWTLQDLGMLENVAVDKLADEIAGRLAQANPARQFVDITR
ncbi:MAG: hypothetical protein Kow0077_02900 [Anaerolineae bacterium]